MVFLFLLRLSLQVDEKQKTVLLSEQGYEDAEEILAVKDLYDPREQWASFVLNAIKAKELFLRDVNYIIRGKEVLIVDEFTGRVMQVFIYSARPYGNIQFNLKSQKANENSMVSPLEVSWAELGFILML